MQTHPVRFPLTAAGLTTVVGLLVVSAPAASAQAYGTSQPYTLTVEALQDVRHHTDVIASITAADGYTAPAKASHVQLKSYAADGTLQWTKNVFDVPLTAASQTGTAVQGYSDMVRYQPVSALVQVQDEQSVAMQNLTAAATVKLRPDLETDTITAPARVRVDEPVNIGALVRELNGDLGAHTDVELFDGDTQIDTVTGLPVLAHGSSTAVFTTAFTTTGVHTLTVVAANVDPGDYDTSNNQRTFTIEVVNPVEPVHFTAQYTANRDINYYYQWSNAYSTGVTTAQGSTETATLGLFGIPGTPAAITDVTIDLGADGVMNPGRHYEVANPGSVSALALDNHTFLYLVGNGFTNTTSVQLYTYGGDYVRFSQWYETYWGPAQTQTSTYRLNAPALNATTSFDARVVVTSGGNAFGGTLSVSLTSVPQSSSWSDATSSGYQSDTAIAGYASGMTTP